MQELTLDRSTYESRVSFDTFDNKEATDISFTLVSKHKDYAYTRRSRTFLCGTDRKLSSVVLHDHAQDPCPSHTRLKLIDWFCRKSM